MNDGTPPWRRKTSKRAIVSLLLGILGLLLFPLAILIYRPQLHYIPGYRLAWIPGLIGLAIGIHSLQRMKKLQSEKGVGVAMAGILLSGFVTICVFIPPVVSFALRMTCGARMSQLGKAISVYASQNDGNYPDPEKWCDQLLEAGEVGPEYFFCAPDWEIRYVWFAYARPQPKRGHSHYAMNPSCTGGSPPDTVLLFETTLGWNQHGGPELLTFDNHSGDGCNVVFRDGHTEFIKDLEGLNWWVGPREPGF